MSGVNGFGTLSLGRTQSALGGNIFYNYGAGTSGSNPGLPTTYLGNSYYPGQDGLWLQNAQIVVAGQTYGFGCNSVLLSVYANAQGSNPGRQDCSSMGNGCLGPSGRGYWGIDSITAEFDNLGQAPIVILMNGVNGVSGITYSGTYPSPQTRTWTGTSLTAAQQALLKPGMGVITANGFTAYIRTGGVAANSITVDYWARGAGNASGWWRPATANQPNLSR